MPDPNSSPDAIVDQLAALADLPGIRAKAEAVREACTRLRFHEALRRRIPEAAAESRVRGARASAVLDGVDDPLDLVRGLTTGGSANDLSSVALDPNVHIQEVKAFSVGIKAGRRPRGKALTEFVNRIRKEANGG